VRRRTNDWSADAAEDLVPLANGWGTRTLS